MYRQNPRKPSLPLMTSTNGERRSPFNELKLPVRRPSRWQLKSRQVNYYPATGTVTDDNFPRALPNTGWGALRRYLTRGREQVPQRSPNRWRRSWLYATS